MLSQLFKQVVWLIKFYHWIYVNLWLRFRGYRPIPVVEYVRLVDKKK